MGNFGQYLLLIIRSLIWPPMGTILFEEQILQWTYATLKVYLMANIANLLIVFAVYAIVMFVVFERDPLHHRGPAFHRGARGILGFILRLLSVMLFSWFMLLYGAITGLTRAEEAARGGAVDGNANVRITFRRHISRYWEISQTFTRLSWHYRFGRWLFRMAYMLLGHIGVIAVRPRLHMFLARAIAVFIIVYRAWEIPYLLTH